MNPILKFLIIILTATLSVFPFERWQYWRQYKNSIRSHNAGHTYFELRQIGQAIEEYAFQNYDEFCKLTNQPSFTVSKDLANKLGPYLDADSRLRYAKRSGSSRKWVDWWGNEIIIKIWKKGSGDPQGLPHEEYFGIVISSKGPNGINENGKGDDIVLGPAQLRVMR